MKILHIITSLRTGGAERLVVELAGRLHACGDEVEVLLFDGTRTPLVDELERGGVPVHALGKGPQSMYNPLLLPKLARFLRKHPFDIVHTHNTPCQMLTAMVPAQTRVTTEHNTANRRRAWRWFRPIDRWMYGRYEKIVCVGEETRRTLSAWLDRSGLDERMTVIPNGIDIERITAAPPAEDMARQEGYKILMVSAFRPEKDQQTLIQALSKLPEQYRLFLAGGAETPEHRRILQGCKASAEESGLADRVQFLGIRSDIPSLLAAADVLVLSSRHEGMSLSVLEGLASGKPMVASDVEGMRELVSGAGLLFPQGDAEALAECIREVCENPGKAREIGIRGKARAEKYDLARTVRIYHDLYRSIAKKKENLSDKTFQ